MTKKVLTTLLLSTMVLSPLVASAATIGSASTKGDIEFKANDDGNTDPDEKDKPTNPGDGGKEDGDNEPVLPEYPGGNTSGALRFVYVPPIKFGSNKVDYKGNNFYAHFPRVKMLDSAGAETGEWIDRPTFVEVVDERGGAKGWEVTASNDGQFAGEKDASKTFKANLSFSNMSIKSNSGFAKDMGPVVPAGETAIGATGASIMKAEVGKGFGGWSLRIGNSAEKAADPESTRTTGYGKDGTDATGKKVDDTKKDRNQAVKLSVPNAQIIDTDVNYQTTINWTITDGL